MFFHPVGAWVRVVSDPVWAGGAGGAGCVGSCLGLFEFLLIVCVLHVAVFGVSSYYMEKFKPGGVGAGCVGSCRGLLKKNENV